MANAFYNVFILLLDFTTRILALRSEKERRFVEGRKGLFTQLEADLKNNTNRVAWFHCSSIGEFEQALPLIEEYKHQYPDVRVLTTFFSSSAEKIISSSQLVDIACYLPLDYSSQAKRFVELVNPSIVFFIKYEFWSNYLRIIDEKKIPLILASAIFRREQPFFKSYGGFHRRMLTRFNQIFVQDEHSQELLDSIKIKSEITGDTRFDRVIELKNINKPFPEIEQFCRDKVSMIVGSMRDEDEALIKDFIGLHPETTFVVAPHEINVKKIEFFRNAVNGILYSSIKSGEIDSNVLIIDNIGILSQIYKYGSYAYVGGGFSDGLHNVLEPAVNGTPVFFGNQMYFKFKEAIDLIEINAGFPVGSTEEMDRVFTDINANPDQHRQISRQLEEYVSKNEGAARKIIDKIG